MFVCYKLGIGKSGILRVSSGSDNSVNPARNRWAPNAVITNRTQQQSKMSELAHANIGKIYCLANANRPRATRTIGGTQPSCVKPDHLQNPRRKCRGGVVGNMLISAHAQLVKNGMRAQERRAGDQISWRLRQGGVVGRSWWPGDWAAGSGLTPVSYTHLTLPTKDGV